MNYSRTLPARTRRGRPPSKPWELRRPLEAGATGSPGAGGLGLTFHLSWKVFTHMSTFGVVICVLILLALWVAVFFRRRSDRRRRRDRQTAWEELVRHYPDLDRELDQFWHRW